MIKEKYQEINLNLFNIKVKQKFISCFFNPQFHLIFLTFLIQKYFSKFSNFLLHYLIKLQFQFFSSFLKYFQYSFIIIQNFKHHDQSYFILLLQLALKFLIFLFLNHGLIQILIFLKILILFHINDLLFSLIILIFVYQFSFDLKLILLLNQILK